MEVIRLLSVCSVEEILEVNNKYAPFFKDRDLFLEVVELLYHYWRRMERIAVVHNQRQGDGVQNVRFVQAYELFNELILSIYRRTKEVVNGFASKVYRQTTAGANAGSSSWMPLGTILWSIRASLRSPSSTPSSSTLPTSPTRRRTRATASSASIR